jgi:3-phosphoshikimate 1-carboxyvinyltransferase
MAYLLKYIHIASTNIQISLPGSKSQSNRALILAHQAKMNFDYIHNLSQSRDTQLLKSALLKLDALKKIKEENTDFFSWAHYQLNENEVVHLNNHASNQLEEESFDFMDAGTPARLILAYFSALGIITSLTGNESLENRSMQPLIDVLESGGAKYEYTKKSGHFPIAITKGLWSFPKNTINRSQSSQYVSALMLIAPLYPGIKTIQMVGTSHSDGYIDMTQKVMADFGIECTINHELQQIVIQDQKPIQTELTIEGDWSSASYFYAVCALTKNTISIADLNEQSCQGDMLCAKFFNDLGVQTTFSELGCKLSYTGNLTTNIDWDLSGVPDLAPTLIVAAAALNIEGTIFGIENLKYKECNRIEALNENLAQFGYALLQSTENLDVYYLQKTQELPGEDAIKLIKTHSDHRMAMVFAPLACMYELSFDDIQCVEKSFPNFWKELQKCNFEIQ